MVEILLLQLVWSVVSYFVSVRTAMRMQVFISSLNLLIGLSLIYRLVELLKFSNGYKAIYELSGFLFLDALNAVIFIVILILALLSSIYSIGYMSKEINAGLPEKKVNEFYFWMNLFIFAMFVVALSNNFGILWIAIEGTTLATAFLISFYRNKEAVEAGWKYIILCSIGISFALFGIIVIYFASFHLLGEGIQALQISNIFEVADKFDKKLLTIAFIFIVVGFGTKVGFAPLHFWLPDAHSQAPTPISALMSGVLLNCAFYAILRVDSFMNKASIGYLSSNFLLFFGLFTVFVAMMFIIRQVDYKRLLAYSSMEHMGIIAMAFGINTKLSIFAGILHILSHAFIKGSIFYSVGSILVNYHTKEIFNIKGLFGKMPITASILLLSVLAITGMPPFSLFITEFLITLEAIRNNFIWQAILLLSLLVAIFGGFIYHFSQMLMGEDESNHKKEENLYLIIPSIIGLLIAVIFTFYIPEGLNILIKNINFIIGVKA